MNNKSPTSILTKIIYNGNLALLYIEAYKRIPRPDCMFDDYHTHSTITVWELYKTYGKSAFHKIDEDRKNVTAMYINSRR